MPEIRKRKPVCLTFVRHQCTDEVCLKETYERMIQICKTLGMEKFDEIVLGEENSSETLRNKGVPELWMYDFQAEGKPTEPLHEYYVLKFDDGSMKVTLVLKDDGEPDKPKLPLLKDPMYG
jgi:hypothetical protein